MADGSTSPNFSDMPPAGQWMPGMGGAPAPAPLAADPLSSYPQQSQGLTDLMTQYGQDSNQLQQQNPQTAAASQANQNTPSVVLPPGMKADPARLAAAQQAAGQGGQGNIDPMTGLTPADSQALQNIYGQMPSQGQQLITQAQEIRSKYPQFAHDIDAITADLEKKMSAYDADIKQQEDSLKNLRLRAAGQQETLDQQITQWAANTPTRQATYAAAMHAAAPLSILAALGGALTHTNAVGLMGATTGIVEGINSGSEQRYKAAMDEWQQRYKVLTDHQQRMMDTFKMMQDAYSGMADADERAATRTRLMHNDQISAQQLKMNTSLGLLQAQGRVFDTLGSVAQSIAAVGEARQKALYGPYGMGFGGMGFGGMMPGVGGVGGDVPQNFDSSRTTLREMSPAQLHSFLGANGLSLPSVARAPLASEMGAIQLYGDMTAEAYRQMVLGGKASTTETMSEARTIGPGSARVVEAVTELNRPGGNFDQILDAARKVDFSNNRWSIQARRWYRDNVRADPDIQDLITAITEAYSPMSTMLAGVGGSSRGATDTTRHWAETELPAYTSLSEVEAAINRSRMVANNAQGAGGAVQALIRQGYGMDQIYKSLVTDPRAAGAGAGQQQQGGAQRPTITGPNGQKMILSPDGKSWVPAGG